MNDQIIASINDCYDEELNDNKKYSDLSDFANKNGCTQAAKIFKDLAHEEYTHACILHSLKTYIEGKNL